MCIKLYNSCIIDFLTCFSSPFFFGRPTLLVYVPISPNLTHVHMSLGRMPCFAHTNSIGITVVYL